MVVNSFLETIKLKIPIKRQYVPCLNWDCNFFKKVEQEIFNEKKKCNLYVFLGIVNDE